jgi:hypothetical protein
MLVALKRKHVLLLEIKRSNFQKPKYFASPRPDLAVVGLGICHEVNVDY